MSGEQELTAPKEGMFVYSSQDPKGRTTTGTRSLSRVGRRGESSSTVVREQAGMETAAFSHTSEPWALGTKPHRYCPHVSPSTHRKLFECHVCAESAIQDNKS